MMAIPRPPPSTTPSMPRTSLDGCNRTSRLTEPLLTEPLLAYSTEKTVRSASKPSKQNFAGLLTASTARQPTVGRGRMGTYFSFSQRDTHHWDAYAPPRGRPHCAIARAFRIRREPGNIIVYDKRPRPVTMSAPRKPITFRSVPAAVLWIAEELMLPTIPAEEG